MLEDMNRKLNLVFLMLIIQEAPPSPDTQMTTAHVWDPQVKKTPG